MTLLLIRYISVVFFTPKLKYQTIFLIVSLQEIRVSAPVGRVKFNTLQCSYKNLTISRIKQYGNFSTVCFQCASQLYLL